MSDNKVVGRIIKISKKGWGFVSTKEIPFTRVFFHWTALTQDTLPFLEIKTGMMVEFTPLQIPDKGYRAIHVKVLERERIDDLTPEEQQLASLPELSE